MELEDAINDRASTITLDDADFASDNGQDAVELSDSDADGQEIQASRRDAGKRSTAKVVTTKTYRISDPLADNGSKKPPRGIAAATGALDKITSFFDPESVRQREDSRMSQSFGLAQLTSTQSEIISLRARIDTLTDQLHEERRRAEEANRRADRAEHKLELSRLETQYRSSRDHHS